MVMPSTFVRAVAADSHAALTARILHHAGMISAQRNRVALELQFVQAMRELLNAKRACLYKLFVPKGEPFVGLAAEADANHSLVLDDGVSWPPGTVLLSWYPSLHRCYLTGQPLEEKVDDAHSRVHTFPVRQGDSVNLGFLVIDEEQPLGAEEKSIIEGMIQLLCNHHALLEYSEVDSLTGLLNRKTFDDSLLNILSSLQLAADLPSIATPHPQRRNVAPQQEHWLGVVDVDHFKQINDTYGHLIGDEILIELAELMKKSFRSNDKLFRFGGEEFVILLRPSDLRSAKAAFDRFRRQVEGHRFPLVGNVTVSIGFSRIGTNDLPAAIIENADESLYWAKASGRNQVCGFDDLLVTGKVAVRNELLRQRDLAIRLATNQAMLPS